MWSAEPDLDEILRVFGAGFAERGGYRCRSLHLTDRDGDRTPEIVAKYPHHRYDPGFVTIFSRDGARMGTDDSDGLIYQVYVEDLDRDGKDELLLGGANNLAAYQGGTRNSLDEDRCRWASVDPLASPDGALQDGSLLRLIFPNYEDRFMERLNTMRLTVFDIETVRGATGKLEIFLSVGYGNAPHVVRLDENFVPVQAVLSDELQVMIRTWPADLRKEFASESHGREWLSRHLRYGALTREATPTGDGQP